MADADVFYTGYSLDIASPPSPNVPPKLILIE